MELLRNFPGCELIDLSQGLQGAKSRQPTTLLVLNAPGVQKEFRAWQVITDAATSIGLDQAGGWSAAALKEYPPALNGALAQGLRK